MSVDLISSDMRNLADFVESQYLVHGDIPTTKMISNATFISEDDVIALMAEPSMIAMLDRRGITATSNGLTPQMLACANVMLDFSDRRSKTAKLAALGLTTQQYNGFVKNRAFNAYVTARAEQLLPDSMHEAHTALLKNVERGETQSLKLYYEITGRHNPAAAASFNPEQLLNRIFEIISIRVKDPETLRAIAEDIGTLAIGPAAPIVRGEVTASASTNFTNEEISLASAL